MNTIKHIYWAIRYGKWDIGFSTRKNWKDKPYFGAFSTFYDAQYFNSLHIGTFYICVSY